MKSSSRFWSAASLCLVLAAVIGTQLPAVHGQEPAAPGKIPVAPPPAPVAVARPATPLQTLAESIAQRPALAAGRVGIRVQSLSTGQILADVDGMKVFQPASNMKLYSTAAALDKLGPDFRIRTSVYAAPPDANGIVQGDLILYGRGDPNLSSRFNEKKNDPTLTPLEKMADAVAAAGVKRITGDLVGDESYFRAAPLGNGWEWNDLQWYYGTAVSALSSNDNQIRLSLVPGKSAGDTCQITVFPPTPTVTIINRTVTYSGKGERKVGIHRGLADNVFEVWGSFPVGDEGFSANLAIHDPALFTASLFKQMLVKRGVQIDGQIKRADANWREQQPIDFNKVKELTGWDSLALAEMIKVVNKHSQNLHAELMLRQVGKQFGPKDKDADEAGCLMVEDLLKRAGCNTSVLRLRDGSGLSRLDYISPESTVKLLTYMHKHAYAAAYLDSLPIAGVDGTLSGRMGKTKAENNLRAKTGTLDDVSSLSGYVTASNGDILVFSIISNNLTQSRTDGVAAGNLLGEALANYGLPEKGEKVAETVRK
ncbi:MAG: D-alanyl-D-alanine carboxypeptidase/D-alanyl-D-alanine-endopeptidase [Blastocatellia bacterium]|nr:D-alanyl-D-alanine carboxypeptidase/D-alanyl-D-alanine-endopeptidase [Blastocatellia bacterium]